MLIAKAACSIFSLTLGLSAAWPLAVHAQGDFPSKPITLVVPYPPGGVVDPVARILAPSLGKELGQTVVVENRAGAAGSIGAKSVARAAPDGHTILLHTGVVTVHPSTMKNAGYDVRNDLVPVSLIVAGPYVISSNMDFPAKTIPDLISYSKANPGKVFYGSAGVGSSNHLAGELLNNAAGIAMTHVPYKGNGPLVAGLLSGEIQIGMETIPGSKALAAAGKLRMLAVTSLRRNPALPDLPSVHEMGVQGYEVLLWEGLFLPKGTPEATVGRWNAALLKVLREPGVTKQLSDYGFEIVGSTPKELDEKVHSDIRMWSDLIRKANIVVE